MKNQNSPSFAGLPDELHPCEHMIGLISRRSDETLRGPARWYTDFHVRTCAHCRTALQGLRCLRSEVNALAGQAPDDSLRLPGKSWEEIEAKIR